MGQRLAGAHGAGVGCLRGWWTGVHGGTLIQLKITNLCIVDSDLLFM